MFYADNFMFFEFNRKVVQFVESGLADEYVSEFSSPRKVEEENGPVVLTFDHLRIWFCIYLGFLVSAILSFFAEFAVEKLLRKLLIK
jgi:hypothetical protein